MPGLVRGRALRAGWSVALTAALLVFSLGLATAASHASGQVTDPQAPERVRVKRIAFSGNSAFDQATLSALVGDELDRDLSLADLQGLARRVAEFYHAHGYFLTQVAIPEQDVIAQGGNVRFLVLEGRLGEVTVAGDEPYASHRVRPAFAALEPGAPIRSDRLERVLLMLNADSGARVSSVLRAGSTLGATDIAVDASLRKSARFSLDVNNFGVKDSGLVRTTARVSLADVTGRGDSLSLGLSLSSGEAGSQLVQGRYQAPVGLGGARLELELSGGRFTVGGGYTGLDITGSNAGWGLTLSYPGLLTPQAEVDLSVGLLGADAGQRLLGAVTFADRIRKLRAGLSASTRRPGARTALSFDLDQGLGPALGGMPADSALSSRNHSGADDTFTKLGFSLNRTQQLGGRWTLSARAAGQVSSAPLVAGEQWAIGGANSVRGFDQSAYSGDDGLTLNLEAHYALGTQGLWQLVGFADYGEASNKTPALGMAPVRHMSGAGLGLRAQLTSSLSGRLDWGVPLGADAGKGGRIYVDSTLAF